LDWQCLGLPATWIDWSPAGRQWTDADTDHGNFNIFHAKPALQQDQPSGAVGVAAAVNPRRKRIGKGRKMGRGKEDRRGIKIDRG